MTSPPSNPVPTGRRFPADKQRIVILGMGIAAVYGAGILAAVWAAFLTSQAVHAGGGIPVSPWALAIFLVLAGMLAVIYGFFFRPREVRLDEYQVSILLWDGSGKTLSRHQLESIDTTDTNVILRGAGRTLVVDRMFADWKVLREALVAWAAGNN
jgi:hypothetical protein